MIPVINKWRRHYIPFPIQRVNIMVYQNHRLKMVIQWKRWMANVFHLDHSSPLRKQWSPLHQVPLGYINNNAKYEAWCTACLAKEVVLLSLLEHVMTLLLEGLDPFNQFNCMIYLSVGGLCRWRCSMKSMKGYVITLLDWEVWRYPRRCNKKILVLVYNLFNLLLLDRNVLGWGCSGYSVLLFTFWLDFEEAKLCSMRDYLVAFFWWENS